MKKIDYVYMNGFVQLPMPFVNCDWLTFQTKQQLSILINFQGKTKRSYPKRETQAYYLGVARETVSTYTKTAEINRVLKVKRHNSGNSNEYDIYLPKEIIAYHIWKDALIKKAEKMIDNTQTDAEKKYKNDEFYKKLHSIQVHLNKLGKEINDSKKSEEVRQAKYQEVLTYLKETLKLDIDQYEDVKVEKKTKDDLEKEKNQPQEEEIEVEIENKEVADQEVDALFSDVPPTLQKVKTKEDDKNAVDEMFAPGGLAEQSEQPKVKEETKKTTQSSSQGEKHYSEYTKADIQKLKNSFSPSDKRLAREIEIYQLKEG